MKPNVPELGAALTTCRPALVSLVVVSGLLSILYLTASFFMLVISDRILPSRSVPSLVGLVLLAMMLYAFQAALESLRGRILTRIAAVLDDCLSKRVFHVMVRGALGGSAPGNGYLPLRDLDQLRAFLGSSAPAALCDLPWMPLYFGICFLFHPLIGLATVAGALLLVGITVIADRMTRGPSRIASEHGQRRSTVTDAGCRNADVLIAMGMQDHFAARWEDANQNYLLSQQSVADVAGWSSAVSKAARMALQSGVLAIGAYLVIHDRSSPGIIVASSILLGRALAPLDATIANWKGVVAAQQSWSRLTAMLAKNPQAQRSTALAAPMHLIKVEGLSVAPPSSTRLTVRDVGFTVKAGQALAVTGPSGSGKSTLVRALVGILPAARGSIRLDAVPVSQWAAAELGRHIGYLPQEVSLFAGTVAQNIARFAPDATRAAIEEAARQAGVHDLIQRLPEGYDTELGEGGVGLSGGQRQRIGLARALYGSPFLLVLDEPNASLDGDGDTALTDAILRVRARGGIVIIVAHRMSALAGVDLMLSLEAGEIQAFGPKDEVLRRIRRPAVPQANAAQAERPLPRSAGQAPMRIVESA
ncbi:type I secretion system permease/ATPase [Methylobacterium planeticum]|uniref:Type I secretion system permease/ATPase n=1 Tax=Methylobacterium planeticum TaxID=2615211 RepID=A0A6N6MP43_9HYPH|nr:type I secretion system permease/ATPase [Methylobacterium planeticum]KAB1070231.1 type I secretion system permease/ATPase [Methylobacterium planeticum]